MTEFIFTFTSITLLVLAAYSIEQLSDTYTDEYDERMRNIDRLNQLDPNY